MGLVGQGDAARLVAHVARVVPKARDLYLRDEDLLGVATGSHHVAAAVQAVRYRRPLVDLVQDARVLLRELDAVGHVSALLCVVVGIVKAGELAPAFHRLSLVGARTGVGKPGLSTLGLGSARIREEPRLCGL